MAFGHILKVAFHETSALFCEVRKLLHLNETKSCLHLCCLEVVPLDSVEELEVVRNVIHFVSEPLARILYVVADSAPIAVCETYLAFLPLLHITIPLRHQP